MKIQLQLKRRRRVTLTTESGLSINTEYVLDATGRVPNVEGIGLENVGINYSKKVLK